MTLAIPLSANATLDEAITSGAQALYDLAEDKDLATQACIVAMYLALCLDNYTSKGGTIVEFWQDLAHSVDAARAITNHKAIP